jgi:hypothetical protein
MALPGSPRDGQLAVIRAGTGIDRETVRLRYNAVRDRWVQAFPILALRSINQIGAHLATSGALPTTKQYVPLDNFPSISEYFAPRLCPELMAQGLNLEYWHSAILAGSGGAKCWTGTYFYEYNDGEFNSPSGATNTVDSYGIPPVRGWAETPQYLHGGMGTGFASKQFVQSDSWLPLQTPGGGGGPTMTKESMYPAQYAYEDAGGAGGSLIFNYTLWLRWIY